MNEQTDQQDKQKEPLVDLEVGAEQGSETNGGINYQAIKYDYRPQDDKHN